MRTGGEGSEGIDAERGGNTGSEQQDRQRMPVDLSPYPRQQMQVAGDLEHEDHGHDLKRRQDQREAARPQHRRAKAGIAFDHGPAEGGDGANREFRRAQRQSFDEIDQGWLAASVVRRRRRPREVRTEAEVPGRLDADLRDTCAPSARAGDDPMHNPR